MAKQIRKMNAKSANTSSQAVQKAKLIAALNSTKFAGRTINGLSNETGMPVKVVITTLKGDRALRGDLKVFPQRTKDGHLLITTKGHFAKRASFKVQFIDIFATNRASLDDLECGAR